RSAAAWTGVSDRAPIAAPFAAAGNGRDSVQPSSFLFDIRVQLLSVANKEENMIRSPLLFCSVYIGDHRAHADPASSGTCCRWHRRKRRQENDSALRLLFTLLIWTDARPSGRNDV